MRVLFLIPGGEADQLDALPAVATAASRLHAQVQVACPPAAAPVWKLLPEVEKAIPFSFSGDASLADWANLLGSVREPDFQAVVNMAEGWPVNLMLSLSHIPNRVARSGFASTSLVDPPRDRWRCQAMEAYLRPLGMALDAGAFRLRLPQAALDGAQAAMPAGEGPLLLLARGVTADGWPEANYAALIETIRGSVPQLRVCEISDHGSVVERAARVACGDVLLSHDPAATRLALFSGIPVVALAPAAGSLPQREGVRSVGAETGLASVPVEKVLKALGLG
jgi:ADP-heptose:LPS heptosyltransferase